MLNESLLKTHPAWPAVAYVCQELQARGHTAYLAGGAVRDALLGKRPKDFDVATSARPHEVEQIFANTVAVGKAFGVIVVIVDGPEGARASIEVTTFRSDGDYKDGRRPDSVVYSDPEKDSERRDFTINALFYDLRDGKVIDFHKGLSDLKSRVIRAVGEPQRRFEEDKLRMLRAIRFAAQLGFEIEAKTLSAIQKYHSTISVVSPERITEELNKLWSAQDSLFGFVLMQKTQLSDYIFRGFKFMRDHEALRFYMAGLDIMGRDSDLGWRWLAFCELRAHGESAPTNEVLKLFSNFKLSRDLLTSIDFCLHHYADFERRDTEALLLLDHKNGPALLQLASLDRKLQDDNAFFERFVNRYRELSGVDGYLQAPFLNGRDIEALGVGKGPRVGQLLKEAYKAQLEGQLKSRDNALKWIRQKV